MEINKRNFWKGNETSKSFLDDLLSYSFYENENIMKIDLTSVFVKRSVTRRLKNKVVTNFVPGRSFGIRSEWEFGITPPRAKHDLSVWYTGENLRPPSNYDITLSFDLDDLDQRNVYLPYWLTLFGDLPSSNAIDGSRLDTFLSPRQKFSKQENFCAVVLNNPHPLRMRLIRELEKIGRVDVFGRAIGRPIASKNDLLEKYRFNLCFENDLYPGYVTEKPFDSWLAGSVPLYWGYRDDNFLNENAIVNFAQFDCVSNYVDFVNELETKTHLREKIVNTPILKSKPSIP